MTEMPDVLVTTADDGSRWVQEEDYRRLFEAALAAEDKLAALSPPSLGMEGVRECAEQFLHDVEDGLTWNSSSSQCLDRIRYLTVLFRKALASISTPSGEAKS